MKAYLTRIRFLMAVSGLALGPGLIAGLGCEAQGVATVTPGQTNGVTAREIHPKPIRMPFSFGASGKSRPSLEFLAPEQMTAADRELAEANQAEIARRAGLQGFGMGRESAGRNESGSWGYEQAACPVFPQHLILEYSRFDGPGDVTLFAAVIPRGEGHVRVIPVRRRSYSLWTPASSNGLTIHDFNYMVHEGPSHALPADWMTLGLCYAALAGGHVRAALVPQTASEEVYPLFEPAMLSVGEKKDGADVRFVDVTPHVKPTEWVLSFSRDGRLLKVKHLVSPKLVEKDAKGTAVDVVMPAR